MKVDDFDIMLPPLNASDDHVQVTIPVWQAKNGMTVFLELKSTDIDPLGLTTAYFRGQANDAQFLNSYEMEYVRREGSPLIRALKVTESPYAHQSLHGIVQIALPDIEDPEIRGYVVFGHAKRCECGAEKAETTHAVWCPKHPDFKP